MTRVLVAGASGFLGYHVCQRLLTCGHDVIGLTRRPDSRLPRGVTAAQCGDLDDRPAIRAALAGVHAVVHLAGRAHVHDRDPHQALAAFRRTNVQGTQVLFEECIAAGADRFVFVSSVKAVGESATTIWTEDIVPAPTTPYGVTKLEAEDLVRRLSAEHGMIAPILRLPLAYGPGVKANMRQLFAWISKGFPLPLGGIRNRRSFVFAGNVAGAVQSVLAAAMTGSETFFVTDQEDLSTPALVARIGAALDRRPRMIPVPAAALRLVGWMGDALSAALPVGLTSEAMGRLTGSLAVDSSKLSRLTGFVPPYSVDQGLRETATWFLAQRHAGS